MTQRQDLIKAQDGDPHAFERLVTPYLAGLFSFLKNRAPQDAEDLYQETLLAAWQAIRGFQGQSSVKTWLYSIAGYKCADLFRKMARTPQTTSLPEEPVQPGFEADRVEGLDLNQAVSRLHPEDRALLMLIYSEGMSVKQAAQVMQIPEGTVKSRLHHLRQKLRKTLGGE